MLDLLSLDEAAKELNISLHTIRLWAFQRRFDTLKLGRRRMIERQVLERFARSCVIAACESQNSNTHEQSAVHALETR